MIVAVVSDMECCELVGVVWTSAGQPNRKKCKHATLEQTKCSMEDDNMKGLLVGEIRGITELIWFVARARVSTTCPLFFEQQLAWTTHCEEQPADMGKTAISPWWPRPPRWNVFLKEDRCAARKRKKISVTEGLVFDRYISAFSKTLLSKGVSVSAYSFAFGRY